MPASTPNPRARDYILTAELAERASEQDRAQLRVLLQAFVAAIDLGFFDESPLLRASLLPESELWQEDGGLVRVRFSAENLPRAAFSVLSGMLVGYTEHLLSAPLKGASALLRGTGDLLLLQNNPAFSPLPTLPFEHVIPTAGAARKALRIAIDFTAPITGQLEDALSSLFRVWDALVIGPFPAAGRAPGDSWIGPTTNSLFGASIEHAAEDFEAGPLAFDLLLRALLRVHAITPIVALEIE